jgi:hypothetical protein
LPPVGEPVAMSMLRMVAVVNAGLRIQITLVDGNVIEGTAWCVRHPCRNPSLGILTFWLAGAFGSGEQNTGPPARIHPQWFPD